MIRDYLDIDRHWGILAYYDALPSDFAQLAPWARMSVMVVGRVTHPSQFLNSLLHEFDHLQDAILQYYQVEHGTEDAAYLQGYLGQIAYEGILPLICPVCT